MFSLQEDYQITVSEIDEKEYISLRLIVSELRNQYVSVDDNMSFSLRGRKLRGRKLRGRSLWGHT